VSIQSNGEEPERNEDSTGEKIKNYKECIERREGEEKKCNILLSTP